MKVTEVDLSLIKPYWRNPRDNSKTIEALKESITDYGFNVPLVIDKDNVIITGHSRYKALRLLGYTHAPCIIKDLDEEKAKKYRIADNKLSEMASWDSDLLEQELRSMSDLEDMAIYFPSISLDDFLQESGGKEITPVDSVEIHKQDEKLASQFQGDSEEGIVEIPCPHCGEPIFLDKAELQDKLL